MGHLRYLSIILSVFFFISCSSGGSGGGNSDSGSTDGQTPTASFTVTPDGGDAPLIISVNASASSDPDGAITNYSWEFGDDSNSEGIAASHTYVTRGKYTVKLTVTDDSGNQDTTQETISVTTTDKTFTLTGTLGISAGNCVDGDVNDPETTITPNNDMAHAQEIPNPSVVGGYVNFRYNGEEGPLYEDGDPQDFYKASLAENETITLYIADSNSGDIDLKLYDGDGNIVDTSNDFANTEFIRVTDGGTYYIEVFAFSGASNYVLTIGQSQTFTQAGHLNLNENFVPGEVLLTFTESSATPKTADRVAACEKATGLTWKSGTVDGPMLFTLGDDTHTRNALSKMTVDTYPSSLKKAVTTLPARAKRKFETILAVKGLRKRSDIKTADLNYIRTPFSNTPNDSYYHYQWNYPLLHLPQAWDITTGSEDVTVAVIDTGVLVNHPDLKGKLVQGYDFISNADNALDGDGIDDDPDDPGDKAWASKSSFHGTHVAGIIAAASDNKKGGSGIGWSVNIMPLRVLGKIGGTDNDILQAVRYAAGLSNNSGTRPAKRADIINLSFGGPDYSRTAKSVYEDVVNEGVILVAAAGNESSSARSYPAAHSGVVAVSAVDMAKTLTPYSNYGTTYDAWIDVAGPGGDTSADINGDGRRDGVLSSCGDDSSGSIKYNYSFMEGTSMAAPHVSGVIALMKSMCPDLTPNDVFTLLRNGDITEDIGSEAYYGNGLIDAYLAVIKAQEIDGGTNTPISNATLVVSPSALNFSSNLSAIAISTTKGGSGNLAITDISSDTSWISVSPVSVNNDNLGTYSVNTDRTGLAIGTHTGTVTFASTSNTATMPVLMQISGDNETLDAGLNYLVLVPYDATPDQAFDAIPLTAENGTYSFEFKDVKAGLYNIYAGTDNDNDATICDWGEACGIYITMTAPKLVTVNGDISGLNFSTGFRSAINESASTGNYSTKTAGWGEIRPVNIRKISTTW